MVRFAIEVGSNPVHILIRLLADRGHSDQSSASMPHMDRHLLPACIYSSLRIPICLPVFCDNSDRSRPEQWSGKNN